ncbi:MAG TPA: hypothetical protein VH054_25745 [Polyangiaceae bacterium]|nr:hypothetical protein [Polyangiaceae bacterium]
MIIHAFDSARAAVLRGVLHAPFVGRAIRRRTSRIALRVATAIAFAFALAIIAPAATLAISPLVLGVPHIASSVRYLVLRRDLPRAWIAVLVSASFALMTFRIAEQYGSSPRVLARAEVVVAALLALVAACHGRRTRWLVPLVALASALAIAHPTGARLVSVHVHNLAAVVVWALVMQRGRAMLPLVCLAGSLALLLFGAFTPVFPAALGVDVSVVGAWLVPGASAAIAVPLVLAHVFTDSVHYAFWLGVIPEETLRNEGTLTFRMTWRALVRDFGRAGLAIVIAFTLGFAALALLGMARARGAYFAIAGFHGYIEGAMLIYLVGEASTSRSEMGRAHRADDLR